MKWHCVATQPGRDWESRRTTLNAQCDESMDEVTADNGQRREVVMRIGFSVSKACLFVIQESGGFHLYFQHISSFSNTGSKKKPSIRLQLHFVKIKVWVVWARENPTFVPNKVLAFMALPLWPGLSVRIEYLLVKGRLRRAQRYVIQFKFRTLLCLSSSKPS
jgi:hypothetical protein